MTTKPLKIYYYKLESGSYEDDNYNENQIQLSNAFSFNSTNDLSPVEQKGGFVSLYKKENIEDFVLGSFCFVQTEELPKKTDYTLLTPEDILFDENDGLLYCTPFLFNPNNNILVYGSNNPSANLSSVRKFVQVNYNIPKFNSLPVVRQDGYEKFSNFNSYSKLSFKVSNPNKHRNLDTNTTSISDVFDIAEESNATEILIELKNTDTKILDRETVTKVVNFFRRERFNEDLKKLIVVGDNENESETIDLLTNRLLDTIEVEVGRVQTYDFESVYNKLIENYKKYKTMLDTLYEEIN